MRFRLLLKVDSGLWNANWCDVILSASSYFLVCRQYHIDLCTLFSAVPCSCFEIDAGKFQGNCQIILSPTRLADHEPDANLAAHGTCT